MVVRKVFFVGVLLGCFFFPFSEICVLPVGIFNRALKIGVIFWVFFLKDIWKLFFFILFFFLVLFLCVNLGVLFWLFFRHLQKLVFFVRCFIGNPSEVFFWGVCLGSFLGVFSRKQKNTFLTTIALT